MILGREGMGVGGGGGGGGLKILIAIHMGCNVNSASDQV